MKRLKLCSAVLVFFCCIQHMFYKTTNINYKIKYMFYKIAGQIL